MLLAHGRSLYKIPGEGVMRLNVGPVRGKSAKVSEHACASGDSPFGPPMYGQGQWLRQVVPPPKVGHVSADPPQCEVIISL